MTGQLSRHAPEEMNSHIRTWCKKERPPPFPQLQKISIEATLYFLMPRVGWLPRDPKRPCLGDLYWQ